MFCDEGITGTSMKKRQGFLDMLDAARTGHIDLILTKSISRFSRNTVDILTVIKELRSIDVEIYFEKENISSADPKIDFILTVMSSMAQEESRSISENTKWGIRKRFKEGKLLMTTKYFLGYDKDEDGNLVINEEQAPTVRYIYDKYLKGMGITELAFHLIDQKIKNGRGVAVWYPDTVKDILKNEKYVGDVMLQKTITIDYLTHSQVQNDGHATKYYIKNNHEPIIDRETYDVIQTMIQARDMILATDNKERLKHLAQKPIKGLVYCSKCHRIYNSKMHNSGTRFKKSMLKCHTSVNNPDNCDNHSIHEPLLERATLHVIETLTKTEKMQQEMISNMEESLNSVNSHEPLKILKQKQIDITNMIKVHIKNRVQSNLSEIEYKTEYSRLEALYKETVHSIEKLKLSIQREHLLRRRFHALKAFIDTNYQDLSIIKSFFGLVLVMGKNHVRYVIDDTFSIIDELHERIEQIKQLPTILTGAFFDPITKENLYYEVTNYEGN
jgi:DNA invertase Pin-like site-specific DNA recombinase